jgi:flagellar M-ring protein FliF
MIDVAQIEGQMRATSIHKVADLVAKHPEEALVILRNWIAADNSK